MAVKQSKASVAKKQSKANLASHGCFAFFSTQKNAGGDEAIKSKKGLAVLRYACLHACIYSRIASYLGYA
jgi:hypothetical protein